MNALKLSHVLAGYGLSSMLGKNLQHDRVILVWVFFFFDGV